MNAQPTSPTPVRTLQAIPPKRVLLVEDDPLSAHTLRLALSVDGHTVHVATSAEDALAILETEEYDVVITDFKLPNMDGLEFAEAVKRRRPSRPVILITAYSEMVQGQLGGVSNVDVLLAKPIFLAKLHEGLAKVFARELAAAPANG